MGLNEYERALELIDAHRGEASFETQPVERLDAAERALGVRFPPIYRRFLIELGSGGMFGEEVYGLVNDDFDSVRPPAAVGLTRLLRRNGHIHDQMVPIYAVGDGEYFGLDLSAGGEPPVVAFTPGIDKPDSELEVIAPDFGTFLLETMRQAIEDWEA
jgi:antitoxin YobK